MAVDELVTAEEGSGTHVALKRLVDVQGLRKLMYVQGLRNLKGIHKEREGGGE